MYRFTNSRSEGLNFQKGVVYFHFCNLLVTNNAYLVLYPTDRHRSLCTALFVSVPFCERHLSGNFDVSRKPVWSLRLTDNTDRHRSLFILLTIALLLSVHLAILNIPL